MDTISKCNSFISFRFVADPTECVCVPLYTRVPHVEPRASCASERLDALRAVEGADDSLLQHLFGDGKAANWGLGMLLLSLPAAEAACLAGEVGFSTPGVGGLRQKGSIDRAINQLS